MNMNEEVICDYLVTAETKKLWAQLIEIYKVIEDICDRNGIKFWADGGTNLGAARHHGFIPWDDDLDLAMPIDDYERFIEVCKDELKPPYFLQTCFTEPGYPPYHLKIRKDGTTGITNWELEMCPDGHRGIFVDIFPLYSIPDDDALYYKYMKKIDKFKFQFSCYQVDRAIKKYGVKKTKYKAKMQLMWKFYSLFTTPEKICRDLLNFCKFQDNSSRRIGFVTMRDLYFDREWFDKLIDVPFEDTTIRVAEKFPVILDRNFGDWHKLVKNDAMHSDLHFSCEIPYQEYLKNLNK